MKIVVSLCLCLLCSFCSANKLDCSYFKNAKSWRGELSAGDSHHKRQVNVILLQQKQAWKTMSLHYRYLGKVYQVKMKGNCFTDHDGDITIKASSLDKPATVVLFVSYQQNTGKLDVGTGMVRYHTINKKGWQAQGGLQGLLKPTKLMKVLP